MSYAEFDAIKIGMASPEQIRAWSHGEVTKPETINYRTLKPELGGLFCERIFGPTKDWECHCGKYKKIRFKGRICDRCGVEVTRAKVRRERMGHIELATPVSHIWYFKGIPSRMGLLLDISPRVLDRVLYFGAYIVTDPGLTPLEKNQVLTEAEYREMREKYEDDFDAGMGAEAVKKLLQDVDLQALSDQMHEELKHASGQKKARIVKRLEVVEAFLHSGNKPEWMIIDVLPVLPPEIRPMVQLDGGRFASSDLNDLYRRVINRNNRLKKLIQLNAPSIILNNEKRMLQEAVDALIDNGRRGRAVTGANNRSLKSLSDMLKGKQGRFRQNLLGKRVDYSGRSVIVVGPELKQYQCGLPKEMAIELFRPFVMKKLVQDKKANNIKSAKKMVDRGDTQIWDALEFVIKEHPVLLNRAPTLHRLGIQAFEPVLVEGRAIKLHPLACTAFNADFDGDQMAVHVPLSAEAQTEARILMLSSNNLLRPQDGGPVTIPTQDMVLGAYYLTYIRYDAPEEDRKYETCAEVAEALKKGELTETDKVWVKNVWDDAKDIKETDHWYVQTIADLAAKAAQADERPEEIYPYFRSEDEAIMAYDRDLVKLQSPIRVRFEKTINGVKKTKTLLATVGRLIYNDAVPQDLGFVDRSDPEHEMDLEIGFVVGKKQLGKIVERCIKVHGFNDSVETLDAIKSLGYHYSTIGSLTVSIFDMSVPQEKYDLIHESERNIVKIENALKQGLINNDERYRLTVKEWEKTTNEVSDLLLKDMDRFNPIFMMADSGARGSMAQIRQLAGMRGLMADTTGRTIEIPIKSNFREGLSVLEYFISSRGARKGMADTALRTADSGYLTRRLVDVAQEVIIREDDCGTSDGLWVDEISESGQVIEEFDERIHGRYPAEDIVDADTGEILYDRNTMLKKEDGKILRARHYTEAGYTYDPNGDKPPRLKVRSVLTCHSRYGVCAKCYGINLAIGEPVGAGEAVGIIAAQSIGEPGTQLTMRTFHSGGVAGGDITQGLPRVEELFEARKPKKMGQLAEIGGTVKIEEIKKNIMVNITITAEDGQTVTYAEPYSAGIRVKDGDVIEKGFQLTDGSLNPHEVLRICGIDAARNYLIREVQKVYRQQGVDTNDKHIEVIVRQMMRKVVIDDAGDSSLLTGSTVELEDYEDVLESMKARIDAGETGENGEELRLPVGHRIMLGITKASLATDSFLAAASFQETTKVLTEAAIKGKVDHLRGLKENVIIGKLIPAGSGLAKYRRNDPELEETGLQSTVAERVSAGAAALNASMGDEIGAIAAAGIEDAGEDGTDETDAADLNPEGEEIGTGSYDGEAPAEDGGTEETDGSSGEEQ